MAMARSLFSLSSPLQTPPCHLLKPAYQPFLLPLRNPTPILHLHSSPPTIRCLNPQNLPPRFQFSGRRHPFPLKATNIGGVEEEESAKIGNGEDKEDAEFRGVGTTPDRFKFDAEAEPVSLPRPPLWALLIALACFIYTWRMVLWELGNWQKGLVSIIGFLGYTLQFSLSIINDFLGDPISYVLYTICSFYSSIVTAAPIPELTTIVILASTVLAIAETTSPDSISTQPYLLTASGLIGYAAVGGFISEPFFWTLLLGLFCIARFIKKRENVSSALPVATVLASVGEPWVRALTIISFTGLAVHHHWKNSCEGKKGNAPRASEGRLPLPLLAVALAIGMRLAAKFAGYRHLTWKIV